MMNPYKLFFKAIGNEARLKIITALLKGPKDVTTLQKASGFDQSHVSHSLKCLYNCGFVSVTQKGKNRVYSLNKETVLPLIRLIDRHIDKYRDHLIRCKVLKE